MSTESNRRWADMDEDGRWNTRDFLNSAIEDYYETGDLLPLVQLLRVGVPDQGLLDIAAAELEAVAKKSRRADKVKAARRKRDRDWDIYNTLIKSSLFGRPEDRDKHVNALANEMADRHGIGSVRQVFAIFAKMRARTGVRCAPAKRTATRRQ